MASALGRIEALSHWVASDHFEELGAPPELFHGGFGLLSVGNLRKPRYWALAGCSPGWGGTGWASGAAATARAAWSRRWPRGTTTGVSGSWSGTAPSTRPRSPGMPGSTARCGCGCRLSPGASYTVRHYRIDAEHSNIVPAWEKLRRRRRPGREAASGGRCGR